MKKHIAIALGILMVAAPAFAGVKRGGVGGAASISSADCSAVTTGKLGDLCQETGDDSLWRCTTTTCPGTGWVQVGGGATILTDLSDVDAKHGNTNLPQMAVNEDATTGNAACYDGSDNLQDCGKAINDPWAFTTPELNGQYTRIVAMQDGMAGQGQDFRSDHQSGGVPSFDGIQNDTTARWAWDPSFQDHITSFQRNFEGSYCNGLATMYSCYVEENWDVFPVIAAGEPSWTTGSASNGDRFTLLNSGSVTLAGYASNTSGTDQYRGASYGDPDPTVFPSNGAQVVSEVVVTVTGVTGTQDTGRGVAYVAGACSGQTINQSLWEGSAGKAIFTANHGTTTPTVWVVQGRLPAPGDCFFQWGGTYGTYKSDVSSVGAYTFDGTIASLSITKASTMRPKQFAFDAAQMKGHYAYNGTTMKLKLVNGGVFSDPGGLEFYLKQSDAFSVARGTDLPTAAANGDGVIKSNQEVWLKTFSQDGPLLAQPTGDDTDTKYGFWDPSVRDWVWTPMDEPGPTSYGFDFPAPYCNPEKAYVTNGNGFPEIQRCWDDPDVVGSTVVGGTPRVGTLMWTDDAYYGLGDPCSPESLNSGTGPGVVGNSSVLCMFEGTGYYGTGAANWYGNVDARWHAVGYGSAREVGSRMGFHGTLYGSSRSTDVASAASVIYAQRWTANSHPGITNGALILACTQDGNPENETAPPWTREEDCDYLSLVDTTGTVLFQFKGAESAVKDAVLILSEDADGYGTGSSPVDNVRIHNRGSIGFSDISTAVALASGFAGVENVGGFLEAVDSSGSQGRLATTSLTSGTDSMVLVQDGTDGHHFRERDILTATVSADCDASAEVGREVQVSGPSVANTVAGIYVCTEDSTNGVQWTRIGGPP